MKNKKKYFEKKKKRNLEILQNSRKNTCVRVYFPATLLKRDPGTGMLP